MTSECWNDSGEPEAVLTEVQLLRLRLDHVEAAHDYVEAERDAALSALKRSRDVCHEVSSRLTVLAAYLDSPS